MISVWLLEIENHLLLYDVEIAFTSSEMDLLQPNQLLPCFFTLVSVEIYEIEEAEQLFSLRVHRVVHQL